MRRADDVDARELWYRIRKFIFDNIRLITRVSIFAIVLVILLHVAQPALVDWLGEKLHFALPSLPSALTLAVVILLLERIFILEQIVRTHFVRIYSSQDQMYRALATMVESEGAKRATLIQYSANTSLPLVKALLSADAEVKVFLERPETAGIIGSSLQQRRIESHIETLPSELQETLSLFSAATYSAPASVAAVRIDQKIIALGWYIYLHVDESNVRHVKAGDTVKVVAHDVPCIVARRGSAEYDILNRFFERLIENYDANSTVVMFSSHDVSPNRIEP